MSLLATASPWNSTNSDDTNNPKKRISMLNNNIRKTVKNRMYDPPSSASSYNDESSLIIGSGNSNASMSISDLQQYNSDKQSRVHKMLDHITKVNTDNDNGKMGDFTPVTFNQSDKQIIGGDTNVNKLLPSPLLQSQNAELIRPTVLDARGVGGPYQSNDAPLGKYTNYRQAHDPSLLRSATLPGTSQYYAKDGGAGRILGGLSSEDQRVMDKINYMIHLLEEQQLEKTNNVMEEFVLYSLLGVFVIYVVDSFSRAGKYMR